MLDLFRLLLDFGVVVLIWLVQLVIYPSFKYFSREGINRWHPKYTFLVSFVIMPLLLGQLALAAYQVFFFPDLFTIVSFILIIIAWILTFFFAVPIHHTFSLAEDHQVLADRLIRINAYRTIVWTLAFVFSLIRLFLLE
ncbi:hypothetical protein [Flavilitoribacter nigricans]|uniref:DUF1772 domain-containing protein n=1 Tax=Flavilitoribacter nigricans (strain ATCC 23147 / DSM 23189 / NBRC 102662 / NCIMB 1420 / SS-2) TaxID=1122177 RepID=A0A2D0NJB2_FLAN2|nr:hypothetical protein [Flavilitoribacter nigricans]PHN08528.1 hypothetical protein CRP01_01040 [Flavilitoribacter nigricans DSM 23189 = NBRC 102662]